MENYPPLLLIAGSGIYPELILRGARAAGVPKIVVVAFENETSQTVAEQADSVHWLRVGQLGKLLAVAKKESCPNAMMAGQIAPKNLFDLRPDFRALFVLARLKRRNAETLFGAIADELLSVGTTLLPATCFVENHLAPSGKIAGPNLKARHRADLEYGFSIAKEVSRLDIGQTVVVKNGTVLAVEGFEGTNECVKRGGALGKGDSTMVKVSKPNQDMRFDVPVIGTATLENAVAAGVSRIGVETGCTLLLDIGQVSKEADRLGITLYGLPL